MTQTTLSLPTEIIIEIAEHHHEAFDGILHTCKLFHEALSHFDKVALFCDRMITYSLSEINVHYTLKPSQRDIPDIDILRYCIMREVRIIHIDIKGGFYMSKSYRDDNTIGVWTVLDPITQYYPAKNTFDEEVRRITN